MNLGLILSGSTALAIQTPLESIREIGGETDLPDFYETGLHPEAPPQYLQEGVGTFTSPIYFAIDAFRLVIGSIAFLVVVFASIKLISTANEEEAKKAKSTLLMGAIGLIIIILADTIVKRMFFGEQGEAFEDITSAELFAEESVVQIRGIIGFIQVFVGITAVFILVIRGFLVLTSAGEEEALTKAKRHVLYAIVGLVAVALSEVVVRGVIFPASGETLPDVQKGRFVLITLTNYLAGFVSILAFASLFYAGYKYVVSAGNEEATEKVKKIIVGAVIALVLALGAFALVNTLIEFEPAYLEETETPQAEVVDTNTQ